jgi:hypothetical protein
VGATAASYANHKNVTHANKAVPTQSFRLAVKPATEAPEQRPNSGAGAWVMQREMRRGKHAPRKSAGT